LPSASHWQASQVHLQYSFLDPDTTDLINQHITVPHASEKQHLALHHAWIGDQTCFQPWTPEDEIVPSYCDENGDKPIKQWLEKLSDIQGRKIIVKHLTEAKKGKFGHPKEFDNILELRIDYGCGYRIYCTRISNSQIMVLLAGNKGDQPRDIIKAKKILKELTKKS
jgi:putative addiction module killer protein